ncbi:hypothetical protein Swit_2207 [Rhizorhabdus wittichii RW1]|uniref:Uncharacterized protein n=1 Tax=Rhizorhabdus wittichii (strain DSM 6014 / CCUG 31198 / JCM 15750 / NBRC 105917 / EY 4224 / RW1) TaxID=392499 RepID=A0A9J9HBE6_RHIWR|nr:hypothetical protein Swit_2207 [Rhizorhabdus wittichii RW1]
MAGGFHIPIYLIEQQASGLQLVHWVRNIWGPRDPDADPTAAVVKLAAWLLAEPARVGAVEAAGISIADVLGDRIALSPETGRLLHEITGGEIGLHDWTRPYSAAVSVPHGGPAAEGDDGARIAPPTPSSPMPFVHGRLGETAPGRLFRVIRGDGEDRYILTGLGVSWAMDRGAAEAALTALADALGAVVELAGEGAPW